MKVDRFSESIRREFICKSHWVFVFVFLISFSSFSVQAEVLPVTKFTAEDGLLRDEVKCSFQDSRGFMWFCSEEGISFFDGYEFRNFTTEDGLPSRRVTDILETRDGDVLIATYRGIARLNPTGLSNSAENPLFYNYLPEDPKSAIVTFLFEDDEGQLWCGTSSGVYVLDRDAGGLSFRMMELRNERDDFSKMNFSAILKEENGTLWFGTYLNGFVRLLADGRVENYKSPDGSGGNSVTSILKDTDGRIWIGTRDRPSNGLFLVRKTISPGNEWLERRFTTDEGLPHNWIRDIYQQRNGDIWVATNAGLCLFNSLNEGSVCRTYIEQNGICDRDLWDLYEDKQNNLWVASHCGASKYGSNGFETFNENDGLPRAIKTLLIDSKGELFVDSTAKPDPTRNMRRVSKFAKEEFKTIKLRFPNSMEYFTSWAVRESFLNDKWGDWWFSSGDGLWKVSAEFEELESAIPQKIDIDIKGKSVFKLFEDSNGDIWVATTRGLNELLRWERKTQSWHDYTTEASLSENNIVYAFGEDTFGNVWIAAASDSDDASLIRYRGGVFKILTAKNGGPEGWVRKIFSDQNGGLWIGTQHQGVWKLENPDEEQWRFAKYTTKEGLLSNDVRTIVDDQFGRIYVGTPRGLNRIDAKSGFVESFGLKDGLPNSFVVVSARDQENSLWFGTRKGLVRYRPERRDDRKPPSVFITGLQVAGLDRSVSLFGESSIGRLDLNSSERQVRIRFSGVGSNIGEALRYEYRLEGSRDEWTSTGERTIDFANLGAGDYRFEVRAITLDNIVSLQPAILTFSIARPIWQRWYVILTLVALIGFVVYLAYRRRLAKLLEMERMRTRIASDLHDDVGANLTRIAILSEVARQGDNGKTEEYLPSIAEIARESVSSMNDIVWAISPDNENLADLVTRMRRYAEEVLAVRDVDLKFNTREIQEDRKLNVELRHDLLLIFKEAVNNAARHSGCTGMEIELVIDKSGVLLRIEDNGSGFNVENADGGNGVMNIRKRAKALNGDLEFESGEDGTRIVLRVPKQQKNMWRIWVYSGR